MIYATYRNLSIKIFNIIININLYFNFALILFWKRCDFLNRIKDKNVTLSQIYFLITSLIRRDFYLENVI